MLLDRNMRKGVDNLRLQIEIFEIKKQNWTEKQNKQTKNILY